MFGHTRLAVLDLSAAGAQPMANEDGTVWVTFNGEIYNHRELRAWLGGRGHVFRSRADTEAIVHAFEDEGPECVRRLDGMFAFGAWDARSGTLLLARDPLGIKPLFYHVDARRLLFASEIKAVLADPTLRRELDREALSQFLGLNYVVAPRTLFAGIRQLPPGHLLVCRDGAISLRRYWDARPEPDERMSEAEAVGRFGELFRAAVVRQLESDVPLGVFLSGGLDSSALAAVVRERGPARTFTLGFGEAAFDEREPARRAARCLGTDHSEAEASPERVPELLAKLVWHAEEPTADASMVPHYLLCALARQHVTVALAGDGADEVLAGYETYVARRLADWYAALPAPARRGVRAAARAAPVTDGKIPWDEKLRRFAAAAEAGPEAAHGRWRLIFDEGEKRELLEPGFLDGVPPLDALWTEAFERSGTRDALHRLLYADSRLYLPNDMLVKVDRMSMAHGLEVRVPFLDRALVEFLGTVPAKWLLRRGWERKHLLRRAMADRLPAATLRRRKGGFNVPVGPWLRGPLREFAGDRLSPAALARIGWIRAGAVGRLLDDHQARRREAGYQLWGLLVLALWWEQFMR